MYRIARSLAHAARPAVRQYPTFAVVLPKIHTVRFFGSGAPAGGGEGEPFLNVKEVAERCIEVIKKFEKVQGKEVTSVSKFKEDLDLDSLDAVEIVMALEEEFHVEVPDAEADKILTVQDAIKYFSEHPMAK